MITSKHKMAPGWRHGWVITLKKLKFSIPDNDKDTVKISTWLLILFLRYHGPKIRTEFLEQLFVYFSYKNNYSLEVICHADKLRWYASTEWIENLSTFPTSDSKLKTTLSIAHSLSYNILNLGTKWSHNNRDTAQRSLPCRFMFVKKSDLP